VGLLPILVPGAYGQFPGAWQNLLGSGVAATAIVAVVLNIVFNHVGHRPRELSRTRASRTQASPSPVPPGAAVSLESAK
jgi:xanthine/uracil permease